jgi:hypothetical protein
MGKGESETRRKKKVHNEVKSNKERCKRGKKERGECRRL